MEKFLAWLETQRANILLITTPLFVIFVILAGICIASSKRGLEDNKPWLKNIVIGIALVFFATTIVTILMPAP